MEIRLLLFMLWALVSCGLVPENDDTIPLVSMRVQEELTTSTSVVIEVGVSEAGEVALSLFDEHTSASSPLLLKVVKFDEAGIQTVLFEDLECGKFYTLRAWEFDKSGTSSDSVFVSFFTDFCS